ncbi:SulP family inorganic anion transporter [Mycobacteroides chelonae]|jgi:SulP family sulfate permease|uniref:Sodium-independent anion transporter n=3 Tax=Mycobacteroides chelonae TaxID=1774 RepID=A0AB73M659_MYCCH|nr:SulP family inorganic anion transporter [Mycobacteroides chelonae]MBV6358919.1 SulP family inorganic anion transporter [Mycobacteroides chelonae]MEC4835465.1 SulP family inorganic anion transporter [Mycobacteroides chelonae]MEC4841731.1 SulP family inorganic anion transporter [Mycobacteroides chelonae]MEC4846561.1 SulP family inorganic anion transporter [Mycobacteroides chelonae]MEC4855678.1 SulP family inorganic anion transporter [Mycobacteroides chelonae]
MPSALGVFENYDALKARRDIVAGLTVAAISLPQAMAYALIAGVDPKYGVYSAIVVTAIASIFGSSSHLINGPTSAISLLVFSSLAFLDPENRTGLFEALFLLGVLVGAIQILIAVFKLGDLTRYISESVVIGFMASAALLLAIGQLANAIGVRDKGDGHMQVLQRAWLTLFHGDAVNYRALVLSVSAVVLAILLRRLVQRYGLPQIDMLLVLIVTAVIAYAYGWSVPDGTGHTDVKISGKIPASLPEFHIPEVQVSTLGELSHGALAIAFIGLIEALSIAKAIAHHTGQQIDYNRQILAEGLANLTGGFFQSLPGSGSLSRSAINYQSGAATRFSGIVSAATVTIALLLFAPLLRYIPQAALAGLLLVTAVRLVDFRRLSYALKASRYDAGLVIITALVGVAVNLDTAVLIGVVLSILLFVPRAAKLKAAELIVTDEGVIRERTPQDNPAEAASSVRASSPVIYDLEGELFFGAAPELDRYLEALHARIRDENLKVVILRLKRVRHPDVVCIERLEHFIREHQELGVTVLLAGVRPDSLALLQNVGFTDWLPAEQVFPEEDREFSATLKAVRYAQTRLAETPSAPEAHQEKLYYLV